MTAGFDATSLTENIELTTDQAEVILDHTYPNLTKPLAEGTLISRLVDGQQRICLDDMVAYKMEVLRARFAILTELTQENQAGPRVRFGGLNRARAAFNR